MQIRLVTSDIHPHSLTGRPIPMMIEAGEESVPDNGKLVP